jgi:hypothetical protein
MKVFISYSQADQAIAKDLVSLLAAAGVRAWDAESELTPGDNWAMRIGQALEESDAMIVLLSPDSVKSEWVRREIEYALSSPNYRDRLIPVIVRPTRKIPWILRDLSLVDLHADPDEGKKLVVSRVRHLAKAVG